MNIKDINTDTIEGRCLMAAIAILTTQPKLILNKQELEGIKMTPDEALKHVCELKDSMFIESNELSGFEEAIREAINRFSLENKSNTPDYVLAKFLNNCLKNYSTAITDKEIHNQ